MVANMIVSIRSVDTNVPVKLVTSYIPMANIAKVKNETILLKMKNLFYPINPVNQYNNKISFS